MPRTVRRADVDGPDFFPTPAWATKALLAVETFKGSIWEPACGDGAMSKVLAEAGYLIVSTDLYYRGYGTHEIDFTKTDYAACDNIVTNPPYNLAEEFIHASFKHHYYKTAFLLRLSFLESEGRKKRIYDVRPPSRVWVFSQRVTFRINGNGASSGGTTAYAWFIWDSEADPKLGTQLKWLPLIEDRLQCA